MQKYIFVIIFIILLISKSRKGICENKDPILIHAEVYPEFYIQKNGTETFKDKRDFFTNNENFIRMNSEKKEIKFFANINYYEAKSIQFKLEGKDSIWNNLEGNVTTKYSNLYPGKYKYQIRYINKNNIIESSSLSFEIASPIYHGVPFIMFMSILITSITTAICIDIYRLIKNKKKYKLLSLNIQKELQVAYYQYLCFFSEYVKASKQKNINFEVKKTVNGLTITIDSEYKLSEKKIKHWLAEYLNLLNQKTEDIILEVEGYPQAEEIDLLRIELEKQINFFKTSIKLLKIKNSILNKDNKRLTKNSKFLKKILINLSDNTPTIISQHIDGGNQQFANTIKNKKNMKIINQNIHGGQQQFADTIINNSDTLTDTDKRFIDLIYNNTSSEKQRTKLLKELENFKHGDSTKEERENSKSILTDFFESGVTEAGKQIAKEVVESGFENFI